MSPAMPNGGIPTKIKGPIKRFPADDLRNAKRFTTTHNEKGLGVFPPEDHGDHHKIMLDGLAVANIIYSTKGELVDLNDDRNLKHAKEYEPSIHFKRSSVARLDFAPGMESPFHRAMSIDYGVVIEGESEFGLDSAESRMMYPGDCSVNRACNHKWRNVSPTKSGRMLFILLDVQPLSVNGKVIEEDSGDMSGEYAVYVDDDDWSSPSCLAGS